MSEQPHGHTPPALDIEDAPADPAGACPDCVRIAVGQLTAERDGLAARATALETDRDDLLAALAAADERHAGLCSELAGARADSKEAEAERDTARAAQERLADDMERLITEVTDERRRRAEYVRQIEVERDRLAGLVERVRSYAKDGCLGSKSTIYNRVGQDLLTIVGDGTEDGS